MRYKSREKKINIRIGERLQTISENGAIHRKILWSLDVGVEHYRKLESGAYGLQPEKMLILYEKYKIDPT